MADFEQHSTTNPSVAMLMVTPDGEVISDADVLSVFAPWRSVDDWWADLTGRNTLPAGAECQACGGRQLQGRLQTAMAGPDGHEHRFAISFVGHPGVAHRAPQADFVMVERVIPDAEDPERIAFVRSLSLGTRTALATIIGYSEIVLEELEEPAPDLRSSARDLKRIHGASLRMAALIGELEALLGQERSKRLFAEERGEAQRAMASTLELNKVLERLCDVLLTALCPGGLGVAYASGEDGTVSRRARIPADLDVPEALDELPVGPAGGAPRRNAWSSSVAAHWLVVPVSSAGRSLAAIVLGRNDRPFADEEATRAGHLAAEASGAVHNALRFGKLRQQAVVDGLTGVFNRRHFFEMAEEAFRDARDSGRTAACILLDIDDFKQTNDTSGHAAGDEVLREVARRFRLTLRDGDLLGRYGGEEFVIYLDYLATVDVAVTVAERLRVVVESQPVQTAKGPIATTISCGVAAVDKQHGSLEAALAAADRAMYSAKKAGRNRVVLAGVYSESSDT